MSFHSAVSRIVILLLVMVMCGVKPVGAQCYCGGGACSGGSACRSYCLCCGRCPPPPPPPSPRPTGTPTSRAPTFTPTLGPTVTPSDNPTDNPTYSPSDNPTDDPTYSPSDNPTDDPTYSPSDNPTYSPSDNPTYSPSDIPTVIPTFLPTDLPTNLPTDAPSHGPTCVPTSRPSHYVTQPPTLALEANPTDVPVEDQNPEFTNTEGSGSGSSMLLYVFITGLSVLVVVCTLVNIRKRRNASRHEHANVDSGGKSSSPIQKHVQHASSSGVSRSVGVMNPMYQMTTESMGMPDENLTCMVPTLSKTWNGEKEATLYLVPTASIADSDLYRGRGSAPTPDPMYQMTAESMNMPEENPTYVVPTLSKTWNGENKSTLYVVPTASIADSDLYGGRGSAPTPGFSHCDSIASFLNTDNYVDLDRSLNRVVAQGKGEHAYEPIANPTDDNVFSGFAQEHEYAMVDSTAA